MKPYAPAFSVALAATVALLAGPALTGAVKPETSRQVTASARVLAPLNVSLSQSLSSGPFKTSDAASAVPSPAPTIVIPAEYGFQPGVQVKRTNVAPDNSNKTAPAATTALITLSGEPGASFTLRVSGWSVTGGLAAAAVSATTVYNATSGQSGVVTGALDAKGKSVLSLGATIASPRNVAGYVTATPHFTVSYN
jgi:hypothetical protein